MQDTTRHRRFETLWREHRGIAFKVASVYARGAEDRRDLAQDIGMQLWRAFPAFDERRARFSTWMYRIALNVAISRARRRSWADEDRLEPLDARHLESIGGGAPIAEPDERLAVLYALIDGLGDLDRALVLLYLEDRSYAEMADVLGISETNVATKIGRIKHKLRARLGADATIGA